MKAKLIIIAQFCEHTDYWKNPTFYRETMDIGLGGETVALLFNNGLVHNMLIYMNYRLIKFCH
jgi:hypothetical protein